MIVRTPRFGQALVLALTLDLDLLGHNFDAPGKPLKEATQDVKVKTFQADGGVEYATIHGQFDAVNAFVREQDISPAKVLAEGDNAATLSGSDRRDNLKLQVIAITRIPKGMTLATAQASIKKSDIEARFKKTYTYGHFIAAMDKGVDIAAWGPNYTGPWTEFATAVRLDRYLDQDNRSIQDSDTSVVYLYGRNGDRTTLAMITGQLETVQVLTSNVRKGEQLRQATNNTFLLQAVLDSSAPYSVDVDGILAFLNGETSEVNWTEHIIGGQVTEMTGIDDTNNFIFTLRGDYAYLPVMMVTTDDVTTLVPSSAFGVKAADIGKDIEIAPISRASSKFGLVCVDQNGGESAIQFRSIGDESAFGQLVGTMVKAAETNQLAV